jgi:hypothetical protein
MSNTARSPEFLTRRGSVWHFVRRVPAEFAALYRRGVIRHSTRIRTTDDRVGRRASRVAEKLNAALEQHRGMRAMAAFAGFDFDLLWPSVSAARQARRGDARQAGEPRA